MGDNTPTTQVITQPRIDYAKAVKLYIQGYPYRDIAHKLGCSEAGVRQGLQRITTMMSNPAEVQAYRSSEAELLDGVQMRLVTSLALKAHDKKASVNNLAYASRQVFDMRRILRDQSTAINQVSAIIHAASTANPPDVIVPTPQDVALSTGQDGDTPNPAT